MGVSEELMEDDDIAKLPSDERDMSIIIDEFRDLLIKWKSESPQAFADALREIVRGYPGEPYYLVKSLVINEIPDFDRIPKAWVIDEIKQLDNSKMKIIIHRHGQEDEIIFTYKDTLEKKKEYCQNR